jgi:hypothetical protein
MNRTLLGLLAFLVLSSVSSVRAEEPYRRPGLGGVWAKRHLTAPMNSLMLLAGPGQNPAFGQRFDTRVIDAGGQYSRFGITGSATAVTHLETQGWTRFGVAFGLTENWEAGALFLPFQWAPDFDFSNILVYVTRGYRFKRADIGIRFSFQTPEEKVWTYNPGVPVLLRVSERARIDAGLFMPFVTGRVTDAWFGLNLPVRGTYNVTPNAFVGLQSGFCEPRFDRSHDSTVPLGALLGYTLLAGSAVIDLTATFTWDNFWLVSAPSGVDSVQVGAYRSVFGVAMHKLVK